MNIWTSIASKKFFQSLLDLLRTRDIPEVQMKLLGLIQKWGLNFEDKKSSLPNFYSVYNKLRNSNVQFPNDFESSYQIYLSNSSNNYNKNNYDYRNDNRNDEDENENSDKDDGDGETFYYMESLKNKLKVHNFEHKYRRLVNFLVKMHENIQMANLLIDRGERSGLKDIINTLREGNNTLIDTISGGRLKDEKLMEITLGTTEDINQTLERDEDTKNGYKTKKFTSYFVLNNVIPLKYNNSHRRAKSTKQKKSSQRRDDRYKNYDMDLNTYDRNKYKEKIGGGPKNADDIFDLFSTSYPSNESQQQNNQPINSFFSSETQIRRNNNQYPQLRNNPMNNLFNNNNNRNNNNINTISFNNNNFQGNNMNNNNNFGNQFNQNNNQQRPVINNFDILEQKLNNLNLEQSNTFAQSTQFNTNFSNNNMPNNNRNNSNNSNLMSMLDQLGPSPQGNSNQLVPYIGSFNQNNNNNNGQFNNNFNNINNNNNQFNNFNNNQFNNFNNNGQNNSNFNNNNQNNYFNNNNQNNNFSNNDQNSNFNNNRNNFNNNNSNFNNNNQFNNMNNSQNNFGNNNNNGNMFNFENNNQMGMSQNMNNNFGMDQNNNNQQMSLEEMEKQRKLKELDDLF